MREAKSGLEGHEKRPRAATEALVAGEPLGPLHGLPVGVKDLNDTEGLVTTYGSPLYKGKADADTIKAACWRGDAARNLGRR